MNLKKLKRLLCIALSAAMVLSTNTAGLAAETTAPAQAQAADGQESLGSGWQLDTEMRGATADEAGIARYVSEDGSVLYSAAALADEDGTEEASQPSTEGQEDPGTPAAPGENDLAQVGDAYFSSLIDAVAEAKKAQTDEGKKVTLIKDAVLAENIDLDGVTIDTQGHTITIQAGSPVTLTKGTVENNVTMRASEDEGKDTHTILSVPKGASLIINGGTYQTKSSELLTAEGEVTIEDGTFKSSLVTAEGDTKDQFVASDYVSASLLSINGGTLTMKKGTVDVEAGNGANNGLYAIRAGQGALVLGEGENGPTLKSYVPAIFLEGTVNVTINNGAYTSKANFDESANKSNAVLCLSGQSAVTIKNGVFTNASTAQGNAAGHVISILDESDIEASLAIGGGTFESSGSVFYGLGTDAGNTLSSVSITGGKYKGGVNGISGANYLPTGNVMADGAGSDDGYKVIGDCGHPNDLTYVKREAADCFKTGVNAHYKCAACGQKFSTNNKTGPTLGDDEVIIAKLNHDGEWVGPEEATCGKDGYKGYYYCKICERCYESMTDLVSDDGDESNKKSKEAFKEDSSNIPHTYAQGDYTFSWGVEPDEENGKVKTVENIAALTKVIDTIQGKEGTEPSVSVSRTCQICKAKQSTADADSKLEVTIAASEYDTNEFLCTEGLTVTLTATVTEKAAVSKEGALATDTFTVKILATEKHDYKYTATAKEDTLTEGNFTIGTSQATVTRTCGVAGCTEAEKSVDTSKVFSKDGTELKVVCTNEQDVTIIARGEFDDNGTKTTGDAELTVNLKGDGHSNLEYVPYKKATCAADGTGNYAYFQCTKCDGKFWDADATAQENRLANSDITIPALDHNFSIPKFEWADGTNTAAKVTFSCINGCNTTIVRSGSDVTVGKGVPDENASCTGPSNVTYPVSVKFHKSYVKGAGEGAVYEAPAANDTTSKEAVYTHNLTKTVVKGHAFQASVAWEEKTKEAAKTYYDITKDAAVVTLECSCGAKIDIPVTYDSEKEKTTIGELEVTKIAEKDVTVSNATITENTNTKDGYVKPICTADGTNVYDITVTCKSDDGKAAVTYNTMADSNDKAVPLRITTATKALGHDYVITDEKEKDGSLSNVYWANESADPDQADDVTVKLACKNDKRHVLVLTGEDEGVKLTAYTSGEPYKAKKCTEDGTNAWSVSVTPNEGGTPITELTPEAELEQAATAAEDDQDTPATPAKEKIYITKENPATGHSYTSGWDTEPYIAGTSTDIFYVSTCNATKCDGVGEDVGVEIDGIAKDDIIWEEKEGKTVRKIRGTVEISASKEPTCTSKGTGTTTVTSDVTIDGKPLPEVEPITGDLPAKGHSWSGTVTWNAWEDTKETWIDVTIDGAEETVKVPVYKITAERGCTNCSVKDTCEGKVLATGTPEENAFGSYIKVEATAHTDASCLGKGSTKYKAVFYGKTNSQKEEDPIAVGDASEEEVTHEALNHDLSSDVSIDWEKTLEEEKLLDAKGAPVTTENGVQLYTGNFTVQAHRSCSRCKFTEDVPVNVTTEGECGSDPKGTITHTAEIAESYDPSDGKTLQIKAGEESYDVQKAGHDMQRIPANTSGDCDKPSYTTHYHCSNCGKNYKSAGGITPIEVSFEIQGHQYGEPKFGWTAEGRSANATFTCTRCYQEGAADNKKDAKLVYTAKVGEEYIDVQPKCTTWAELDGNQGKDGRGTAYYAVSVSFTEGTLPKGLTELSYEDELEVRLPLGDHSFKADADGTEKCEYCGMSKTESVKVIYKTDSGTILREDNYTTASKEIDTPPTAPNQAARQFDHWEVNDSRLEEGKTLVDTIIGLLKNGGTITVTACYKELEEKATVTVEYRGLPDTMEMEPIVEEVGIGKTYQVKVEAGPLDAENNKWYFSHWISVSGGGDNAEAILGYGPSYDVYVQSASPITICAVYTKDEPATEAKPTIVMANQYCSTVDGKDKVSFTATMNIPEGYTMVESGILYTTDQASSGTAQMTLENIGGDSKVRKSMMNGKKANTFTAKVSSRDTVVYARGYLRYTNAENVEEVIYTDDVASGSFNTLPALALTTAAN